MGVIEKRTQAERLVIIESLLVGINSEIYEGDGYNRYANPKHYAPTILEAET